MAITINGTGTLTGIIAGGLPDGIVTTADINFPLGKVLQVKVHQAQSEFEYQAGNYGTWYDYDEVKCTFTPSKAGTKMMVIFNARFYIDGNPGTESTCRIKSVSTEGTRYFARQFYTAWDAGEPKGWPCSLMGFDAPNQSSVNEITYTAQHMAQQSYSGTGGYSGIGVAGNTANSVTNEAADSWIVMEYE